MNLSIYIAIASVCISSTPVLASLYNDAVMADRPYLYWTFDEPAGSSAIDLVRGIVLEPSNNVTRVAHEGYGSAAMFDGTEGTHFVNNHTGLEHLPSQLWVLEMWLRQTEPLTSGGSIPKYYLIDGGEGVHGNDPAIIYGFQNDKLELFSNYGRSNSSAPSLIDTNWHHVVMAFYGREGFGITNRHDIWIDGIPTVITDSNFSSGFNLRALSVGTAIFGGHPFKGCIDELAIYDIGSRISTPYDHTAVLRFEAFVHKIVAHPHSRSAELAELILPTPKGYAYTGIHKPSSNYHDNEQTKLIDGAVGSPVYADGTWVGIQNYSDDNLPQPQIDFDLGRRYILDAVEVTYLVDHAPGIYAPDYMVVSFSNDGHNFYDSCEYWGLDDSRGTWIGSCLFDFPDQEARFVRLQFFNDREWTFLGEIQFMGTTNNLSGTRIIIK